MNRNERQISANLDEVRDRIAVARQRAGRGEESVQLIAVTKYAEWEWVETLLELGVNQLGESRPQQLIERQQRLGPSAGVEWHLIGHLQRNKVRPLLPLVSRIHSVDTLKLLERMDFLAGELELKPRALLEVNLAEDPAKDGFSTQEILSLEKPLVECSHVQITGLMTMAPHTNDELAIRKTFQQLRALRDDLEQRSDGQLQLSELSMGMSGDFEIAIEEGATHVRVGRGLYAGLESAS